MTGFQAAGRERASAHRDSLEPGLQGSSESYSDGTGTAVPSGRHDPQTQRSAPYPASGGLPWQGGQRSQAPAEGPLVS